MKTLKTLIFAFAFISALFYGQAQAMGVAFSADGKFMAIQNPNGGADIHLTNQEDAKKIQEELTEQPPMQPLVFGPETEVMSVPNEMGGFSIVSAEPKKLIQKIIAEEKKATANVAQRNQNIEKRIQALRSSNQSVDTFLIQKAAEYEKIEEESNNRSNAINIIVPQWQKAIDQDIPLLEKVEILKKWARIAGSNPWLFYAALEKVKKDFALESAWEEMNETDEQSIQHDLEKLVGTLLGNLDSVVLLGTGQTFGAAWVSALTQAQKNATIIDLYFTIADEFNRAPADKRQNLLENKLHYLVQAIRVLRDEVSKQTRLNILNLLKKIDLRSNSLIDDLIKEISAEIE